MAATLPARRLTEAHRRAQAALGAQTVVQMRVIWALLDPEALDATFERWLTAALPIIRGQRITSARLAAQYIDLFKKLELGPASTVPLVLAEAMDVQAATTSLLVTGPVSIKSAMANGMLLARATDTAQARSAAAAMRHALGGGRDTINRTITADRQALGYARAASGKPCAFCAMLASRGPVYSKDSAGFEAHDGCSCTSEPVYRHLPENAWPAGSARYRDLWDEATVGHSGKDAINAFRSALTH